MSEFQVIVCELSGERYGLDIGSVFEIIRHQPIRAVPAAPPYVKGIINLRERIVPVVDLAARFGLPNVAATKASRIIVAGTDDMRVGLIVDGVSKVQMVADDAVERTPDVVSGHDSAYIRGIAKISGDLVILLELSALFGEDDRELLAAVA
jgi:purine-binding chemotaxis protein CheW